MKKNLYPITSLLFLFLGIAMTLDAQEPIFSFLPMHPFGLNAPPGASTYVKLVDIDHDDILEAFVSLSGPGPGKVHYYENDNDNIKPHFVFREADPFGLSYGSRRPWQFVDIDGDGLQELFMSSFDADSPVHMIDITEDAVGVPDLSSAPVVNPYGITLPVSIPNGDILEAVNPTFVDIDNDGDYDVFLGGWFPNSLADEKLFYMENNDPSENGTAPRFDSVETNPFGFDFPLTEKVILFTFADLDNDSDFDMYMSTVPGNDVFYFENKGTAASPDFSGGVASNIPAPFSPPGGSFLDICGDGDLELINGSLGAGIDYYENMEAYGGCITVDTKREENIPSAIILAPNPVKDELRLFIRSEVFVEKAALQIFDPVGQLVFTERLDAMGRESSVTLDISQLSPGLYFLTIGLGEQSLVRKFVKR